MSILIRNRTDHNSISSMGRVYWRTEFERVYLMAAARIRGERVWPNSHAEAIPPPLRS